MKAHILAALSPVRLRRRLQSALSFGTAGLLGSGLVWLLLKAAVWYTLSLWVRNSLPRLRMDQVMAFNWKFLVPLSIVNLLVTAFLLQVIRMAGLEPADPTSFVQNIPQTLVLLVGNLVIAGGILVWLRNRGRRERTADSAKAVSAPVHAVGD